MDPILPALALDVAQQSIAASCLINAPKPGRGKTDPPTKAYKSTQTNDKQIAANAEPQLFEGIFHNFL